MEAPLEHVRPPKPSAHTRKTCHFFAEVAATHLRVPAAPLFPGFLPAAPPLGLLG